MAGRHLLVASGASLLARLELLARLRLVRGHVLAAVAAWLQIANFKIVSCAYYQYSGCLSGSPLRLYWSLSLEEQFYIVFPALLFFLGRRRLAIGVFALFAVQFFLHRPWPSPLWFFRTDAICLGILIACLHARREVEMVEPKSLARPLFGAVTAAILCFLLVAAAKIEIVWFFNGLVSLIAGMLVFVASFDKGYLLRPGLLLKVSAFIGERSYSLYLTHMVALVMVKELSIQMFSRVPANAVWMILSSILALALMAVFSEFSYRRIEQPLRRSGVLLADEKARDIERLQAVAP